MRTEKAREQQQIQQDLDVKRSEEEKSLLEFRHSSWVSDQEYKLKYDINN